MSAFRKFIRFLDRRPVAPEPGLLTRQYDFFVYDVEAQYERLISYLSLAIERDPANAFALHNRGTAYDEVGETRLALSDFDRAIGLTTAPAGSVGRRGMAKEHLGDFAGAVDDYTRAIELEPSAALFGRRARAHARLGDAASAASDDAQVKAFRDANPQTQAFLQATADMRTGKLE